MRSRALKWLHVTPVGGVNNSVRLVATCLLCACAASPSSARNLNEILKGVEARYNSARTLEARFEQRWLAGGRPRRAESGTLKLLKPGKMRWDYTIPAGKLFLSDGKTLWYASPATGRVERTAMKNADDFRTPLAFLLGRLSFKKTFQDLELRESGSEATIVAIPKASRAPYSKVEFTLSPANEITRLLITGLDETIMEFRFSGEKLNASIDSASFRYTPPAGVEVVEVKGFGETEAER
jgi:chaperone LolA